MEEINPVYDLYKSNNLTDLSEVEFLDKYSNPDEAQKIWQTIAIDNKMTDDDFSTFYDKYLKKKESAGLPQPTAPSSEPSLPESPLGTKSPTTPSGFTRENYNPLKPRPQSTGPADFVAPPPSALTGAEKAEVRVGEYTKAYQNINLRMRGIDAYGNKVARGYMDRVPEILSEGEQIQSQIPVLQEIAQSPLRKESERIKAKQDLEAMNIKLGQLDTEFNTIKSDMARDLDRKFQLFKGIDMQKSVYEKELEKNFSYLDRYSSDLLGGTISTIGNTINLVGDLTEKLIAVSSKMGESISGGQFSDYKYSDDKITDQISSQLVKVGDQIINNALAKTPANLQWNQEQGFSQLNLPKAGLVATQAIASMTPAVVASLTGTTETTVAVSFAQNYSDAYKSAKEAGMDDEKALFTAVKIAIPVALLDAFSLSRILKTPSSVFGGVVTKQTLKQLATKNISKEAITTAVDTSVKQALKRASLKGAEALVVEPITEGIQGGIQAAGIELEKPGGFDENSLEKIGYSMAGEAFGGLLGAGGLAPIGMYSAYRYNPSAVQVALSIKQDPEFAQDFSDMISHQVKTGQMTQEEAVQIGANIEKINGFNAAVPSTVTNPDARVEAISLMNMRQGLIQEIEGKDPAMISEQQAQIKEIEEKLSLISKTNKPTSVQTATTETTEKTEEPVLTWLNDRAASIDLQKSLLTPQPQTSAVETTPTQEEYKGKVAAITEQDASNDVNEVIAVVTPVAEAAKGKGLSARQVLKDLIRTGVLNELSTTEEIDQVEVAIEATLAGEQKAETYNYQSSIDELASAPKPETVEEAAPVIEKAMMNGIAEGKDADQIMADIMGSGVLDDLQGQEDINNLKSIVQREIDASNGAVSQEEQARIGAAPTMQEAPAITAEGTGTTETTAGPTEANQRASELDSAVNKVAEKNGMNRQKVINILNKYNPSALEDPANLEEGFNEAMKKRAKMKAAEEERFAKDSVTGLRLIARNPKLYVALRTLTKVFSLVGVKVRVLNDKNFADAVNVFSDGMLDSNRNAIYDPNTKTIFLKASNAKQTAIHEFAHPLLDIIKELDPAVYSALEERIKNLQAIKPGTGMTYYQWAQQGYKGSSDSVINNEAIAEFLGDTLDFNISVPAMIRAEAINFLNSILSSLGFKSFAPKTVSLQDFMSGAKNLENVLYEAMVNKRVLAIENIADPSISSQDSLGATPSSGTDQGTEGQVGTFNIPDKEIASRVIDAPSASRDERPFIKELVKDIDLREFNGMKFITNMYDYTNAGVTDLGNGYKINLFGGKNYVPYMMAQKGKALGEVSNLAAFNSKEFAEGFINNSLMSGSNLFAPHSGSLDSSWQFQQHTFAELMDIIVRRKMLTNEEIVNMFDASIKNKDGEKAFKQFKANYKAMTGNDITDFSFLSKDPLEIVTLLDIENNLSPDLRKILNSKISTNKPFQSKLGIKSAAKFYTRIMDPLNVGVMGGEIMGVVDFDPSTFEIIKTEPDAIDHHPSFGWTVMAKINGIYQPTQFHKSIDITDSYTKYNKNEVIESRPSDATMKDYKLAVKGKKIDPKTGKIVDRKRNKKIDKFVGSFDEYKMYVFDVTNVSSSSGSIVKVAQFNENVNRPSEKPIASQAAVKEDVKPVFAKSAELFDQISETEGASKKRSLAQKRRELLSQNPSVKFIDDNIGTIYAELEAKGLLKREGNCP